MLLRSKGVVVSDRWKGADSQLRGRAESPLRVEQLSWQEDQRRRLRNYLLTTYRRNFERSCVMARTKIAKAKIRSIKSLIFFHLVGRTRAECTNFLSKRMGGIAR